MFPEDIYLEILLRLPVKSLLKCKCVCKTWLSLISDPSFVKSHLNLKHQTNQCSLILIGVDTSENFDVMYSLSHDLLPSLLSADKQFLEYAVEIVHPFERLYGAYQLMGCGGLVCLCSNSHDCSFCLWNPATKEYKILPKSPHGDDNFDDSMIGLGYDSKTDDYRLVRICSSVVEVYSLRPNSWTSIEYVPNEFSHIYSRHVVGVLVNRDLHWLVQAQDSSQVLAGCFDVADHIFKVIQLPNELPHVNTNDWFTISSMKLGALEGCLCVLVVISPRRSEVWVMQDYGVQESWTKRHIINFDRDALRSLIFSFKSGEILFGLVISDNPIIYYPKDETVRKPNMPSLMCFFRDGCYYESLVSLGSGTYVGEE